MDTLKGIIDNNTVRKIIIAVLALMAVVSIVQGCRNAAAVSQDFQWDAARALVEGIDPYEISLNGGNGAVSEKLSLFYKMFEDDGIKQNMEANQFPSLLYLLAPYTLLSPLHARYAWLLSNLIFTALIMYLLRKTFLKGLSSFEYACSVLLMLAGTPYRNQLGVGQHTLFSFCFFLLAVYYDEKAASIENTADKSLIGRYSIIITICMFVSYFKYTLTAPLTLYLLYRKRYKEFAVSVLGHIILTAIAAKSLGTGFIYMIKAPLQVSSALSAEGGIDLGALLGGGSLSLMTGGIIAVILCIIMWMLPANKEYILFPLLLLWSLILTYHRTYDFFVLSAAAALFTREYSDDFGIRNRETLKLIYYILLFAVYFGLRAFHENRMSLIMVGGFYYIYTIYISIISMKLIKK